MVIQKEREEFEKLPDVHKKLKDLHPTIVWFCDQGNKYASSFEGFQNMVIWLNGAWYAFQEQQKIIDELIKSNIAISEQLGRFKKELLK